MLRPLPTAASGRKSTLLIAIVLFLVVNNIPISTPPKQLGVLVSLVDRSCLLCNTFHVATTPVCLSKLPAAWRFSLDDCTWEDCTTRWQRAVWQPLACTGRCKVFNPCRGIFFTLFKPRGDKPLFAYSGRKDLGG